MNESERSSSPNESRFEEWLAKSLHRVHCPDSLELGEYAVGLLTPEAVTKVESHLDLCPKCRAEVNFLRNFTVEETLSQPIEQSAENWLDKGAQTVRSLVATLQKSLPSDTLVGALRGTVGDQLVYEVEDLEVVIDIQQDPGNHNLFVIHGLVVGFVLQDMIRVGLFRNEVEIAYTEVDEIGNFDFTGLEQGSYQLALRSANVGIMIHDLKIE